jgi:hypothetical protein
VANTGDAKMSLHELANEPLCLGSLRRFLSAESKIAAVPALHDGGGPGELEVSIKTSDHGEVALAMKKRANFGRTQLLIELSIATARYIEIEPPVCPPDAFNGEAAAASPDLFDRTQSARTSLDHEKLKRRRLLGSNRDEEYN